MKAKKPRFKVGETVECQVTWPGGGKTWMRGPVIAETEDEVFIQTDAGGVAGDRETAESCE